MIVVDESLCVGCRTCEIVCSLFRSRANAPELSRIRVRSDFLQVDFVPNMCFQCTDPPCMQACPIDAMFIDEKTGAIVVNEAICIGCRACIEECGVHFSPPRLWVDPVRQVVLKCDLCGGDPQCVRFCTAGAITYSVATVGIEQGHPKEEQEIV